MLVRQQRACWKQLLDLRRMAGDVNHGQLQLGSLAAVLPCLQATPAPGLRKLFPASMIGVRGWHGSKASGNLCLHCPVLCCGFIHC